MSNKNTKNTEPGRTPSAPGIPTSPTTGPRDGERCHPDGRGDKQCESTPERQDTGRSDNERERDPRRLPPELEDTGSRPQRTRTQ